MTGLQNLFWFLIGVSLLVTVHEYGHFWVARKLGFKVLRFSIGFGKPLYKKIGKGPDHVEYVIAALPLGGYVKMLDEREGKVAPADAARAFGAKPPWQRILVMLAGPAANILFAIVVLWIAYSVTETVRYKPVVGDVTLGKPAALAGLRSGDEFESIDGRAVEDQGDTALGLLDAISGDGDAVIEVRGRDGSLRTVTLAIPDADERHRLTEPNQLFPGLGFDYWEPDFPAKLAEVVAGGPAEKGGLRAGDVIVSLDGQPVANFKQFREYIQARPATAVLVRWQRDGAEQSALITTLSQKDEAGNTVGRLSLAGPVVDAELYKSRMQGLSIVEHLGPVAALGAAVRQSWDLTVMQAKFFGRMITGKVSMKNLSSPIGIAGFAGDSARAGPGQFVKFLVLISLSLGFLNLLPIPILDGGQVVFTVAEWLKGSPLSERVQALGWNAGLVALALLMGIAVFNDLASRFG